MKPKTAILRRYQKRLRDLADAKANHDESRRLIIEGALAELEELARLLLIPLPPRS